LKELEEEEKIQERDRLICYDIKSAHFNNNKDANNYLQQLER